MKMFFKLVILLISASLSSGSYAFPEMPFCPAGGPPGWMNYFNYKRDQNNRHRYYQYATPTHRPTTSYRPDYRPNYRPVIRPPYNYSTAPYNTNQNYYRPRFFPNRNY